MKLTWLGHASFKIEVYDQIIYIDPYKGNYDSKADIILISHDHYDHFSESITRQLIKDDTIILCASTVASKIHSSKSLIAGDIEHIGKTTIKAVSAYNIDKPFHSGETELGFLITTEDKTIYFAGDTDLIPEMHDINADILLLPVSGTYVMNPKEASQCVEIIHPKVAIPMHYGSVVGTLDDAEMFKELVEDKSDVKVIILDAGQEIII